MKRITITDANIFIDLIRSELIDYFFQLEMVAVTTQYVLRELYPEQERLLLEYADIKKLEIIHIQVGHHLEFSAKLSDVQGVCQYGLHTYVAV